MNLQKHEFTLPYDMKETAKHVMDAERLGKSLISMASSVKQAGKILNGESSQIKISVKAHSEGSFAIEFVAWLQAGGIDVLRTIGIATTGIAVAAPGILAKIREIKGRAITARVKIEDTGNWKLSLKDGSETECTDAEEKLLGNRHFLQELEQVIYSATEGCEDASVKLGGVEGTEIVVSQDDSVFFKAPPPRVLQHTKEEIEAVNIIFIQVNLERKTGWKIKLPNGDEVSTQIADKEFLKRIKARERSFSKGDMFEVRLKTVEKILDGKTSVTRTIIEVIRHRVEKSRKVI